MAFRDLIPHQTEETTGLHHECPRFLSRSIARVTQMMSNIEHLLSHLGVESTKNLEGYGHFLTFQVASASMCQDSLHSRLSIKPIVTAISRA